MGSKVRRSNWGSHDSHKGMEEQRKAVRGPGTGSRPLEDRKREPRPQGWDLRGSRVMWSHGPARRGGGLGQGQALGGQDRRASPQLPARPWGDGSASSEVAG